MFGIDADAGAKMARLHPFYLTAYRRPDPEEEGDSQKAVSFILEVMKELCRLEPRAAGPISVLWTTVVEALDPQERGSAAGGWASFDDEDMTAIDG